MKILYVAPSTMRKTEAGAQELARRGRVLQDWASHGTQVEMSDIENGPMSIESHYEEYLAVPDTLAKIVWAEKAGYDSVIVGCFGDPGVDAARELVSIPVIGPGEVSMLVASMLGHRYGIIAITDSSVPTLLKLARCVGTATKLASVRAIGISVLEVAKDWQRSTDAMIRVGRSMVEKGVDSLIMGCMSMAFMDVSAYLEDEIGVPVVNPVKAALYTTEMLLRAQLTHSKRAYPVPPKLASR